MVIAAGPPAPPIVIAGLILLGLSIAAGVALLDFGLRSRIFLRGPLADLREARAEAVQAGLFDSAPFSLPPLRGLRFHQVFRFPKPAPGLRERLFTSLAGRYGIEVRQTEDGRLIVQGRRDRFLNLNAPNPFDFREVEFTFRGTGHAVETCEYTVNFEGLGRVAILLGCLALLIAGVLWITPAPWILPAAVLLSVLPYGAAFVRWRYRVQVVIPRALDRLLIDCLTAR